MDPRTNNYDTQYVVRGVDGEGRAEASEQRLVPVGQDDGGSSLPLPIPITDPGASGRVAAYTPVDSGGQIQLRHRHDEESGWVNRAVSVSADGQSTVCLCESPRGDHEALYTYDQLVGGEETEMPLLTVDDYASYFKIWQGRVESAAADSEMLSTYPEVKTTADSSRDYANQIVDVVGDSLEGLEVGVDSFTRYGVEATIITLFADAEEGRKYICSLEIHHREDSTHLFAWDSNTDVPQHLRYRGLMWDIVQSYIHDASVSGLSARLLTVNSGATTGYIPLSDD